MLCKQQRCFAVGTFVDSSAIEFPKSRLTQGNQTKFSDFASWLSPDALELRRQRPFWRDIPANTSHRQQLSDIISRPAQRTTLVFRARRNTIKPRASDHRSTHTKKTTCLTYRLILSFKIFDLSLYFRLILKSAIVDRKTAISLIVGSTVPIFTMQNAPYQKIRSISLKHRARLKHATTALRGIHALQLMTQVAADAPSPTND